MLHRELGRAPCNRRVFDARTLTAGGETDHVILKTVDPAWPAEIYDDDILRPSAINRTAMRGYALRRDDEPNLALVLPGGVHLSNVLGVRSRSDPDHEPRLAGRRLGIAFATAIAHAACRALEALHDAGGRHGALTPENILLDERGGVHILDLYPHSVEPGADVAYLERAVPGHGARRAQRCLQPRARDPRDLHADRWRPPPGGTRRRGRTNRGAARRAALAPAHLPAAIDRVLRVALADHPHHCPGAAAFGDAFADAADRARPVRPPRDRGDARQLAEDIALGRSRLIARGGRRRDRTRALAARAGLR